MKGSRGIEGRPFKRKRVAERLALGGGLVGAHHFYLGRPVLGTCYVLVAWTLVPFVVSFVEWLVLRAVPEEDFNRRWNPGYPPDWNPPFADGWGTD